MKHKKATSWSQRRKERQAGQSKRRPGNAPRIPKLYACLSIDAGDEGIVGSVTPMGVTPLIASTLRNAQLMLPVAQRVATGTGIAVELVEFVRGETLRTFEPDPASKGAAKFDKIGDDLYRSDGTKVTETDYGPTPEGCDEATMTVARDGDHVSILLGGRVVLLHARAALDLGEGLMKLGAEILGGSVDGLKRTGV